jgi:hypothetical protein
MNKHLPLIIAAATLTVVAQDPQPAPPAPPAAPASTTPEKPSKRSSLKYVAPASTTTGKRIDGDGGLRDSEKHKYPKWISTLTPSEGAALTTREQPSLFAFVSDQTNHEVRFTVTEPAKADPAFVFAVSQCAPGIRRVNLAEYGLTLPVGKDLKWSIIVRPDKDNRSLDLFSIGNIKRVQPDPALVKKLKDAPPSEHAAIYAEAGIWYDALGALADQIAANPNDADLLAQQRAFLDQVGLTKVVVAKK